MEPVGRKRRVHACQAIFWHQAQNRRSTTTFVQNHPPFPPSFRGGDKFYFFPLTMNLDMYMLHIIHSNKKVHNANIKICLRQWPNTIISVRSLLTSESGSFLKTIKLRLYIFSSRITEFQALTQSIFDIDHLLLI